MIKKIILFAALSTTNTAFASNPLVVSVDSHFFGSATAATYSEIILETLTKKAKSVCAESKRSVEKLSAIQIQVNGDFTKRFSQDDNLTAENNPITVASAIVNCK